MEIEVKTGRVWKRILLSSIPVISIKRKKRFIMDESLNIIKTEEEIKIIIFIDKDLWLLSKHVIFKHDGEFYKIKYDKIRDDIIFKKEVKNEVIHIFICPVPYNSYCNWDNAL